jgi:hypothetical protein
LGEDYELTEAVTKAIVNANGADGKTYMDYDGWCKEEVRDDFKGEMAAEWMAARRAEARAAILVVRAFEQEAEPK